MMVAELKVVHTLGLAMVPSDVAGSSYVVPVRCVGGWFCRRVMTRVSNSIERIDASEPPPWAPLHHKTYKKKLSPPKNVRKG
jgi:hypothetical protein